MVEGRKKLKKELGLFTLIAVGLGTMLGSGIFALPAVLGAAAGPALILAILIAGIITLFLGIAYAELGAAFPLTGGPYAFPRLAMGDLGGFVMGWGYFLYLFIGTAAVIDIFIVYLGFYIPGLAVGSTLTPLGIVYAVAALWIFTIINLFGVKWGGLYGLVTTIGKIIPLCIFAFIGFAYFKEGNFVPFMPFGFTGVTLAAALFFWAYTGFEAIVVPAEEVKKPYRTIPLAMIFGILTSIIVYLLIAFAFVGMIDWQGVGLNISDWKGIGNLSYPLSSVAQGLNLPWLATLATIGAIIATGGCGGSWVLVQGRMPYAMAQDKLFWAPLAHVHHKFGTPMFSLLFSSSLTTIVLIAIPSFPSVAIIASITAVVPYAAAVLSVPILRKTKREVLRPFRLPWHFLVTGIGFILSTFLFYWAAWPWTLVAGFLILTGYPIFLLVRVKNLELKRNLWLIVYILGIVLMSFLGDPKFSFNNFLPWNPIGILEMPYDLVALSLFAIFVYVWAYRANTNPINSSNSKKS